MAVTRPQVLATHEQTKRIATDLCHQDEYDNIDLGPPPFDRNWEPKSIEKKLNTFSQNTIVPFNLVTEGRTFAVQSSCKQGTSYERSNRTEDPKRETVHPHAAAPFVFLFLVLVRTLDGEVLAFEASIPTRVRGFT